MKKLILCLVAVAVSAGALLAQSVDAGKKFYYYQRYNSAKEQFEKVLAANPNNLEAVYWLGHTLVDMGNQAGAKDLFQKSLMSNGAAPMVLVGMGYIELLEGKNNDARQRFETAISLTRGKEIDVLNAVADVNVDAKAGDANYAIEKLNAATQIKKFNDASTYCIMGDAYRKLVDGGAAVTAYQKALAVDPKYAEAKYKIGKVYLTQNNKEYFLPAFEEAVQMDPNYAPAYYELYYYWYYRDINKAVGYFDKYVAVSDPSPKNEYDKISILYPSKKYAECISASQQKINTEGTNTDPRYYKLIAYCYSDQGDSLNAKKWLDQYFAKQKTEDFLPKDYSFRAQVLAKFPGNEKEAFTDYDKAVQLDTALQNKLELMNEAAALAKKIGDRTDEAKWLGKVYRTDPKSGKADLYNLGYSFYQAQQYDSSIAIFSKYKQEYPDEIFGYLWSARSYAAMDTAMQNGAAVPDWLKFIEVAKKADSVKYKSLIVQALFYMASYSNDIKKDKDAAIAYLKQVTAIDPTNETAPKFIEILSKPPAKQPATKRSGGGSAKPASKTP
jgi:tetratricopeptide (TPR) repeat protein